MIGRPHVERRRLSCRRDNHRQRRQQHRPHRQQIVTNSGPTLDGQFQSDVAMKSPTTSSNASKTTRRRTTTTRGRRREPSVGLTWPTMLLCSAVLLAINKPLPATSIQSNGDDDSTFAISQTTGNFQGLFNTTHGSFKRNYPIDNSTIHSSALSDSIDRPEGDGDDHEDLAGGETHLFDARLMAPATASSISLPKTHVQTRQAPPIGGSGASAASTEMSLVGSQQAAAAAAFALAQEDKKAANKLNAELCRNFSIGFQTDKGGVFTSPNYPNPYPINLVCTRLIEAPLGHYIIVEFRDQFNIEEAGNDCDNDKIEIRDGRFGYSKVLARYCGNKFPPEVKSSNEAMWLRFISDGSITHNGFKAVYKFEKQKDVKPNPPFECRFNVTTMPNLPYINGTDNRTGIHSGIIKHTDVPDKLINYTREFNVSLECIWNITVSPGWKIYLTFSNYEINKPNDCDSNFIEIYEENLTEENQTVKFCGTRTEPQQSRSNVFNIRHHAIPSASGSRFEIIYTAFREKGPGGCDAMEFDCDDGTCIHDSLKCDGIINCKYRYDEASDPGPCQSNGDTPPFFETEHMVIILIVFLTLVSGMCASIIISCWGKIQERRRRKLEYHIRKSREASMEGQINKVDQLYGSNDTRSSGVTGAKQRSLQAMNSENSLTGRQFNSKYPVEVDGSARLINGPNGGQDDLQAAQQQQQQQLAAVAASIQYQQNPALIGQMMAEGAYGRQLIGASNSSLDTKGLDQIGGGGATTAAGNSVVYGSRSRVGDSSQDLINKSHLNAQQSLLASMSGGQQKGRVLGGGPHLLDQIGKQQTVPDVSFNNQQPQYLSQQQVAKLNNNANINSATSNNNQFKIGQPDTQAHQQQMLNLSLIRNQLAQQQHQKQFLANSSMYQQDSNDSNSGAPSTANQQRLLRQHQNIPTNLASGAVGGMISSAVANHQPTSTQTMPINLTKFNLLQQQAQREAILADQQQQQQQLQLNFDLRRQQQQLSNVAANSAYNQRALTLSTMHRPLYNTTDNGRNLQAIYGMNVVQHHPNQGLTANNHLSSSVTCCNNLADCLNETPLLGDLISRASSQQQQQQHQNRLQQLAQTNRLNELRSSDQAAPSLSRNSLANATIPRSMSAYQLSKSQARQNQQQQIQQQQQQQMQLQKNPQLQHHLPYKSMSDAGHANKHLPPNHSISYPHACTGVHQDMDDGHRPNDSPALPPPPPPPNLVQVRSSTSCATLPPGGDMKRAAFKVSRLDPSQLTGDTLPDSDLMMAANMPMGSMQFDDPSTESDATFGMLMNSIGNTSLGNMGAVGGGPLMAGNQQIQQRLPHQSSSTSGQQHPMLVGQSYPKQQPPSGVQSMQQPRVLTHLNECNFVRRQRAEIASGKMPTNQMLICDCGALDRANQLRLSQQQQQALHQQQQILQHQQQQQQQHQQQRQIVMNQDFDLDSDEALGMQEQLGYTNAANLGGSGGGVVANGQLYGQQQMRYNRFRQQSSELTGDDDEIDDEDDEDDEDDGDIDDGGIPIDGYNLCDDQDDSSDMAMAVIQPPPPLDQTAAINHDVKYATRSVIRRNEELRDAPMTRKPHLSGSHTSISCQSCTCGSQSQLNQLANDQSGNDDVSSGDSKLANENQAIKVTSQGEPEGTGAKMFSSQSRTSETELSGATETTRETTLIVGPKSMSGNSTGNCDNTVVGGAQQQQQQQQTKKNPKHQQQVSDKS